MTVSVALPTVPSTTPAWLIKGVSLLVALAGPGLVFLDPDGKITSGAATAIVLLGFLAVAAVIFTVHLIAEAIKAHGFSRAALGEIVTQEQAELKQLWPEFKATYAAAKPALDQLPAASAAITKASVDIADVQAKVSAVPASDRAYIEGVIRELVIPGVVVPPAPVPDVEAPAA